MFKASLVYLIRLYLMGKEKQWRREERKGMEGKDMKY